MQFIKHLLTSHLLAIAIIAAVVVTGCEKVIDVDLNSASPKYVIEGAVTNAPGPQQLRITQTKNFDENNNFEGVRMADVRISDDAGNTSILTHTGDGLYETNELEGVPGRTYFLQVEIGNETFTAEATMPEPPAFDSLYIDEFTAFGSAIKIPTVIYSDARGIDNYYRYLLYINNIRPQVIFIGSDDGIDGNEGEERSLSYFRGNEGEELEAGDTVTVEMQSIGKEVYEYFFSLGQTISQDAATPANPLTNISGSALGYFSAHSVQIKTIVVE